jgi:putative flippase GtrA
MTTFAPMPVSSRVVPTLALPRQFGRFVAVGVVNTGLFLVVYLVLRTQLPITAASLVGSVLTTFTSTNANGRVTFAAVGRSTDGELREVAVLVAASSLAGILRFVMMRSWVFPARAAGAA